MTPRTPFTHLRTLLFSTLSGAICVAAATSASAGAAPKPLPKPLVKPLEGYHKIWEAPLPCDGVQARSPTLSWQGNDTYRVQVTGMVILRRMRLAYDAEFKAFADKEFRQLHSHLLFDSPAWKAVYRNSRMHRHVYALEEAAKGAPRRVFISFDGLPRTYRFSPARFKQESKCSLRVSVWKKGPAPGKPWALKWWVWGGAGLGLVLVLGVWWGMRRRRAAPAA